ncbi:MAG: hypothetical protein JWN14_2169 [Chthonomonadales bacterium]|nr:hypothetical protein [Chthonomonadales bacterium]
MGTLTPFLQNEFERLCPVGWMCRREVRVQSEKLGRMLGYAARADVLLQRIDGSRRFWIEFEISRADPVANHAKFATGHLFEPQAPEDIFVSMISPHVARGRRNLAANAISLMRCVGMNAFQTVLLPHNPGIAIQQLNETPVAQLSMKNLPVQEELARIFAITQAVTSLGTSSIHLVGDLTEVLLNLRQFNLDLETSEGRALFGRRTVTFFVYDRVTKMFAPSKFCAYTAIPDVHGEINGNLASRYRAEMTVAFYAQLDETDRKFDGRVARLHLEKRLAMSLRPLHEIHGLEAAFASWIHHHRENITVHPSGAQFLLPPAWF